MKIVDGRVGKLVVEVSSDLMEDLLSPWWIVKSTVQDRSRLQKDTKCTEFLQTQGSDENGVAFKIDNKKWPVRQVGILFQVTLVAYIDGHVADVASSGLFAYHGSGERGKSKPKSSEPADGGKKKRKGKPSVGEWVMEAYNAVNVNILEILWRDIDAFSRGAGGGGGGGGSGFVVSLKEKHDKLVSIIS